MNILETIAQQIDKIAEKPLEAAFGVAMLLAFYQWLGWWGIPVVLIMLAVGWLLLELSLYAIRRDTFVKYKDTSITVPGFHPFRARAEARKFDNTIKAIGEERFIAEISKYPGVRITHRKESVKLDKKEPS